MQSIQAIAITLVVAFGLWGGVAKALEPPLTNNMIAALHLSDEAIDTWLDALDKLVTGAKTSPEKSLASHVGVSVRTFSRTVELARETDLVEDLAEIVAEYGFKSAEEWAAMGDRISRAHLASEMDAMPAIWKDIENLPRQGGTGGDPEDAELVDRIAAAAEILKRVSKADKDAVRAYIALMTGGEK